MFLPGPPLDSQYELRVYSFTSQRGKYKNAGNSQTFKWLHVIILIISTHLIFDIFHIKPQEEHCLTREKSERSNNHQHFILFYFALKF